MTVGGVAPTCPGCGGLMSTQGPATRRGQGAKTVKLLAFVLFGLFAAVVVWKAASWGYHRAAGYELLGKWRAEQTSVMGFSLPIGANLEFAADSAMVLDTRVPVAEYEREGNLVHVIVAGGSGVQANFTFRFDDADHIVYDGPLGVTLRYRRVKAAK